MSDEQCSNNPPDESPAILAFGTDGTIYINIEEVPLDKRKGRAVFQGLALSPEEAAEALDEIHKLASNVPTALFASKKPT